MTVSAVRGAVDDTQHHALPPMVGFSHDTRFACRRCGSAVTSNPMFCVAPHPQTLTTAPGQHATTRGSGTRRDPTNDPDTKSLTERGTD